MTAQRQVQNSNTHSERKSQGKWILSLALLLSLCASTLVMAQNTVLADGSIRGTPRIENIGVTESVALQGCNVEKEVG